MNNIPHSETRTEPRVPGLPLSAAAPARDERRLARLPATSIGILLAHAVVFASLAAWSWRKWPDPLIDFGRELYLPWRITQGAVLYRDLASLFGPLSPYLNALWFRLFGVSLTALFLCNMAILAALTWMIYRLVRSATDRITACTASLAVLLLFGFSQYLPVGNYNFVAPYSHEATHGLAAAVAMVACLHHAIATRRLMFWGLSGIGFGMTILTKPEVALAAAATVGAAAAGAAMLGSGDRRDLLRAIPLFALAAGIPPLLFFAYFVAHVSAIDACRAVTGMWTTDLATLATSTFYRAGMGFDEPAVNATRMFLAFAGFVGFSAAGIAVSLAVVNRSPRVATLGRIGRLLLLVVAILFVKWGAFPRALPLTVLASLAVFVPRFWKERSDRRQAVRYLLLIMWSALSLVLLAKMGLGARFVHYGFYLALPATVTTIVLTCGVIPALLDTRMAAGTTFRTIAVWTVAASIAPYLGLSHGWYRTKVLAIGSGGDRFLASAPWTAEGHWQGAAVRDALDQLAAAAGPDTTVAVLPEGVMINYLLRRRSPLRVINVMPPELLVFGEDEVLRSLQAAPPDFVLLVHKDVTEYGYSAFGSDPRYGSRILSWVDTRYHVMSVIGRDPRSDGGYGIEIRRRNP